MTCGCITAELPLEKPAAVGLPLIATVGDGTAPADGGTPAAFGACNNTAALSGSVDPAATRTPLTAGAAGAATDREGTQALEPVGVPTMADMGADPRKIDEWPEPK
mmetsp:Transcript_74847/g.173478  ORF Transcript_74847/g.173478 Transcript_74847/m.173478 type:complete len:106 (-) Transcript_74847:6-323(-)